MKILATAALNARLAFKQKARTTTISAGKTTKVKKYPQIVNYLLRTYAMDENVADTKHEITMSTQPPKNAFALRQRTGR